MNRKYGLRDYGKFWIITQILYNLYIKFFISEFHVPYAFNYLTDIINIIALFFAILVFVKERPKINFKIQVVVMICLIVVALTSTVINHNFSLFLFLWAARNVFRFFLFWFTCVVLLDKKCISIGAKIICWSCVIHFFVAFIQFYVLGVERDSLNGIFGTVQGYGAYANVLICTASIIILVGFVNEKVSFKQMCLFLLTCSYYAGIAELKIYVVELLCLGFGIFILEHSKATIKLVGITIICSLLCGGMTLYVYPEFRDDISQGNFVENYTTTGGYGMIKNVLQEQSQSSILEEYPVELASLESLGLVKFDEGYIITHLNRLSGIKHVKQAFLYQTSKLFWGIGFGNAQISSFSLFQSKFADAWELLGYASFSHLFLLLEIGVVGVVVYLAFFATIGIKALGKFLNNQEKDINMAIVLLVGLCFIFFVYNSSLQVEGSAYLIFGILALPFIKMNTLSSEEKVDES